MVIYYYIIYIIITHDRNDMETLFLRLVSLSLVILFLLPFFCPAEVMIEGMKQSFQLI